MATELKASVNVDVGGFKQGMQEAAESTKTFEREIEEINASAFPKLRKEMAKAKNDAKNLGMAYSQLSDEAKQSKFGQELKRQFDEAVQSAAQLRDLNGDIDEKIKNLSSDTLALDIVSDSFDVVANSVTGVIGTIGTLTGNSEDAQRAMSALAASTGLVNAATKVTNMLQPQSNLLIGIGALQAKAKAKADELAAAATGKATIAQKAFNAVAKANPYVLLAVGVGTLVAAIGTYVLATRDAESETDKFNKEAHDASVEAQKDAAKDIAALDQLVNKISDTNTSQAARKQAINELRSAYPGYFADMTDEQMMLVKLSSQYQQLKGDIIAVAQARGYQAKIEQDAVERVEYQDKIDEANAWKKANAEALEAARKAKKGGYVDKNTQLLHEEEKRNKVIAENQKHVDEIDKRMGQWQDKIQGSSEAQQRLNENTKTYYQRIKDNVSALEKQRDALDPKKMSGPEFERQLANINKKIKDAKGEVEDYEIKVGIKTKAKKGGAGGGGRNEVKTELEKLTAEVNKYKKQLEDVDIKAPNANETIAQIKENLKKAESELKSYKIAVGIEVEPEENSMQYFSNKISELEKQKVNLEIGSDDWNKIQAEIDDWNKKKAEKEISVTVTGSLPYYEKKIEQLKKQQINLEIGSEGWKELEKEINDVTREQREVQVRANIDQFREDLNKSITEALTVESQPEFDFSFLPKDTQKEADQLKTQTQQVANEMKRLKELMADKSAAPTEIEEWTRAYQELEAQQNKNIAKLKEYNEASKAKGEKAKDIQNRADAWGSYASMLGSVGSAMDALGDSEEAQAAQFAVNTAATIANCISQIAAMQASAIASGTASGAALPFPANIAAIATIVATIASIFASLPKFAEGGIIGGNSYTGDKLLARVNSKEAILNEKQQQRALDLMDANSSGGSQRVVGVIKGTDILLVAKNTNKKLAKSGTNISFG